MSAVFELEVKSFRKLVKNFACLTSEGINCSTEQPCFSRSYFYSIGSWLGNSDLIFRISKVVGIKYIVAQYNF